MTVITPQPLDEFEAENATPRISTQKVEDAVRSLAQMDQIEYELVRDDEARQLGVRVGVLDRLRKRYCSEKVIEAIDTEPETPEPWDTRVEGVDLLDTVSETIRSHVHFEDDAHADALAVWCLGSFNMDVWQVWPKVLISSPEKRCGKTTLVEVLEGFMPRALITSNMSSAALFRAIEAWKVSLLIDEADRFLKTNEELNGLINAGHRRRSAYVIRTIEVDGQHIPKRFPVWAPMVIAGIGSQADTLHDRSVRIGLRRKKPSEVTLRMPGDFFETRLDIRRMLIRWSDDNHISLASTEVDVPNLGNDRAQDNWQPLFRIAKVAGGDWPDRVLHAYTLMETPDETDEDTFGIQLIRDCCTVLRKTGKTGLSSTDIVNELDMLEDTPWSDWKHGKPITTRGVASLLKPYGIKPRRTSKARGYSLSQFLDALDRYAPAPPEIRVTSVTSVTSVIEGDLSQQNMGVGRDDTYAPNSDAYKDPEFKCHSDDPKKSNNINSYDTYDACDTYSEGSGEQTSNPSGCGDLEDFL